MISNENNLKSEVLDLLEYFHFDLAGLNKLLHPTNFHSSP
jgi:hypothetical protein